MIIRNLFFIKQNKIAIFRIIGDQIVPLKKDGNIFFEIEGGFWDWWKETTDYIEGDDLDFCFIWDKENSSILQHPLFVSFRKDSVWNTEVILNIIDSIDKKIKVCSQSGEYLGDERSSTIYQSNIDAFVKPVSTSKTLVSEEKREGKIDKYFKKLKQQEEAERMAMQRRYDAK